MTVVAACSTDSGNDGGRCTEDEPSCSLLWGIAVPGGSASAVQRLEHAVDEKFDFVYSYHDINDVVPSADDKAIVAAGHDLHISIIPRDFKLKDKNTVPWRAVADGDFDSSIMRQARGIARISARVFITFDHEPDQLAKSARGSTQDYVDAWRHVYRLYQRAGAENVTWVWVMMGWGPELKRAAQLWPGNKYVDWVSWEAYNHAGCLGGTAGSAKGTSFQTNVEATYNWLHTDGDKYGIDPNKPIMISEAASVVYPDDADRTAAWYAAIPTVLRKFPQIKAITLFDLRTARCDYEFQNQPAVLQTVRSAIRATQR